MRALHRRDASSRIFLFSKMLNSESFIAYLMLLVKEETNPKYFSNFLLP